MNKAELSQALEIAQNNEDLSGETDQLDIFNGFALSNFKQITVSIHQLAALVRWQCVQMNNSIDTDALDEISRCRHKFIVV